MQKEKNTHYVNPLLQYLLIFVIILIEIFEFVTNMIWKIIPFKKKILGAREWFYTTKVYKTYKKLVEKALGLEDKNFVWLLVGMSILAIPFIYVLPFLFSGVIFKILFIVIGKIISSTTTALIALGSEKLLKIDLINVVWTAAKNNWQSTKDYFNNLKYVKQYRIWKDKQEGSFLKQLKFFSSKIKDKGWRKEQLLKMKKTLDLFPFIDKSILFIGFILLLDILNILDYFLFILILIRLFQFFGSKTEENKVSESLNSDGK